MSLIPSSPVQNFVPHRLAGIRNRAASGMRKQTEPSRLKKKFWPEEDRLLWDQCALQSTAMDIIHAEQAYGRWLTFLYFHQSSALEMSATARITHDHVNAYVAYLGAFKKNADTIQDRLRGLMKAAWILAPKQSWWFIYMIAVRLRRSH